MLSVIDVIKSLTVLINENFPDYPVNDRDLNEGFIRPSYFIDVEQVRGSTVTAKYIKEEADLQIAFFEEDIYYGFLKLLDVKNELLMLLSRPLKLTDENDKVVAHITFNDVQAEVVKADKALTCTMSYELVQEIEQNEGEYMIEHVDVKVGVN